MKSGDFRFGNPSSQHSAGKSSRKQINESRDFIFKTFGVDEKDYSLFFHSGATEAFTTMAYSFAEEARLTGKDLLICYSQVDHPAVTTLSEKFLGSHVKFLELKRNNQLEYLDLQNFEVLKDKKDQNPELLILYHHLWVHNETGFVSPLNSLAVFKTIPDLYIHVDAVQSPGKIPEWQQLSQGDIWSYSSHKFGGFKGTGFSLMRKALPFHPLLTGGGQQTRIRAGTENPMAVHGTYLALSDLGQVDIAQTTSQRKQLEKFIVQELAGAGELMTSEQQASNTIYFYLRHLTSDVALALFDVHGLMISAGSACMSGSAKASTILNHLGLGEVAKNGLRLSLPLSVSAEERKTIESRLKIIFEKLKA